MKLMNLLAKTQATTATATAIAAIASNILNSSVFLSTIGQVILSNLSLFWR